MATITDALKAEVTLKHGKKVVFWVNDDLGLFVFKKPTRQMWKQALAKKVDPDAVADPVTANEKFCADCLVHPTNEKGEPDLVKLEELWEDEGASSGPISAALSALIGTGGGDRVGKV